MNDSLSYTCMAACKHGYRLCVHGKCDIDCGEASCEPSLEHEYYCTCAELGCKRDPCTGAYCGCTGCKTAYIDVMGSRME